MRVSLRLQVTIIEKILQVQVAVETGSSFSGCL